MLCHMILNLVIILNLNITVPRDGEGNGIPLQYSCLENSVDRGAGQAKCTESQRVGHNCATDFPFIYTYI